MRTRLPRILEPFSPPTRPARGLRVCLFTDTLGDINGVSRFVRTAAGHALATGRDLTVLTSTNFPVPQGPNIVNFPPRAARPMPGYANLELALPPVRRMIAHVRQNPPDVIHISTPGPIGLVGRLAAKRLHLPVVGVYHTDFPAYVERLFDDGAMTWATRKCMGLFYRRFDRVFARSDESAPALRDVGIESDRTVVVPAGIDTDVFHPRHREPGLWERLGARAGSVKVLYVGRVSVEKNLPLLVHVWKDVLRRVGAARCDAQLIIVGDGPYRAQMEQELAGAAARFLGFRHAQELSAIYASADLFLFPSVTDTLGQVVMEAQASGLAAVVSDRGGPKGTVRDGVTGWVVRDDPQEWADAAAGLIADPSRRAIMGAAAHEAMQGRTFAASFEKFWTEHEKVWDERLALTAAREHAQRTWMGLHPRFGGSLPQRAPRSQSGKERA